MQWISEIERETESAKERLHLKCEILSDMETERGVSTDMAPKCIRKDGSRRGVKVI